MPASVMRRIIPVTLEDRSHVVINAELREGGAPGELSDAFAVTCEVYEPHGTWSGVARRRNGRACDAAGCAHDEVLRAAPGLAPLVALHLADPDGTPMHASANAFYFYSGGARRYEEERGAGYANREGLTDHERAARALRLEPAELPTGLDKDAFYAFVAGLRDRWQAEAEAGRALLESIPPLESLRGYSMAGEAVPVLELPAGMLAPGAKVDV